jgi:hypothetical protein
MPQKDTLDNIALHMRVIEPFDGAHIISTFSARCTSSILFGVIHRIGKGRGETARVSLPLS